MSMKNVLVIGSFGFIGSHLITFLQKKNIILKEPIYNIFACDIIPYEKTVQQIKKDHYFQIYDTNHPTYEEFFLTVHFDAVINCSGAASVPLSFESPLVDFNLNTVNVIRILEAIRLHSKETLFINFSSAGVYGNPQKLPITENEPIKPVSPYGFHKMHAENICAEYSQLFGLKTISLRVFSAYGEGLRKQIFWDIVQKALHDETIQLFGTGDETRDFIHVQDICAIVGIILDTKKTLPSVLNVANGFQISIRTVTEIVCSELQCQKPIIFSQRNRTGDPVNWEADISLLSQFGYKQSITFQDGVSSYVSWAKEVSK